MGVMIGVHDTQSRMKALADRNFHTLDLLPGENIAEKITSLVLQPVVPYQHTKLAAVYNQFKDLVTSVDVSDLQVVVLGGGTGLSNILGGDSKGKGWQDAPFTGLKEIFDHLSAVVCVTDDGGSTGELLKDLPLIALGDLRHVLLSAVRKDMLMQRYALDDKRALVTAATLSRIINYRFISPPASSAALFQDTGVAKDELPVALYTYLLQLMELLFSDTRLTPTLTRPQCLGNLLLAAAIYQELDMSCTATDLLAAPELVRVATIKGLNAFKRYLGVQENSVLPCTTTPAQLQMAYDNGVLVTSEAKSSRARRGYPVDRVWLEFLHDPYVLTEVIEQIRAADVIVYAPGSLYTSIIPILQVPGIAATIRENDDAVKILVANLWAQTGETDLTKDSLERKFYVSDLIRAYNHNIPAGVNGLFDHVISLNMSDVPGSILQKYAVEQKIPIYLDRNKVEAMGYNMVAASIHSEAALRGRGVLRHDPDALAQTIKTLWVVKAYASLDTSPAVCSLQAPDFIAIPLANKKELPCCRYQQICSAMNTLSTELITEQAAVPVAMEEGQRRWVLDRLVELVWLHPDITLEHLKYFKGITLIDEGCWKRSQQWDNVFSFYDPVDQKIKIRRDQSKILNRFEVVFFIALGQSLLGNYALKKEMVDVHHDMELVGRMYKLTLRDASQCNGFLTLEQIKIYLELCKMQTMQHCENAYSRIVNLNQGFTPPGLFFGLFYAWYLDNRFAPNIEYNMSIMKNDLSDLIPEQVKLVATRKKTIAFFREHVFSLHGFSSVSSTAGCTG
ncbi:MAG: hypothetical protein CSA31_01225 [Desulfobulbus propionicus]|nr:MAG: hypothetical protein CSA31_01225 [Desulfobulbus propionicus]